MSEEMAVGDNATGEDAKVNGEEAAETRDIEPEGTSSELPSDSVAEQPAETPAEVEAPEPETSNPETPEEPKDQPDPDRGVKRRASNAFSDNGDAQGLDEAVLDEEFKGFDKDDEKDVSGDYRRILERLEAEVTAAAETFSPLRTILGAGVIRASKRMRQDTDGSRPSSAQSSRSDGMLSNEGAQSPKRVSRRATTEMSSPLLRVPLEQGWKRELVYRAALDQHQRRNADIYYYSPFGKKLRSSREISEHLSGTGLTLENFSFFKEPLGLDDPEKEIIRFAKPLRRVESPVSAPAPEGKRTPKPKAPKGASPEPSTPISPPAKIKVKSMGSRLSSGAAAAARGGRTPPAAPQDNNNSAQWKKPRQRAPSDEPALAPLPAPAAPLPVPVTPPPPLQSRPSVQPATDTTPPRTGVQPCSLTCGRGVPTLACLTCLCLYHPFCAGYANPPTKFFCKNCKSPSPCREPPPLLHKSGVPAGARRVPASTTTTPVPVQVPVPVPVPVPAKRPDKRVLLRMKVSGGGPDGERVWAVAKPPTKPATKPPVPKPVPKALPKPVPKPVPRQPALPQSLAVINGRRFIVVPRNMVPAANQNHEEKRATRGRIANGAASPDVAAKRRGRSKADDTDHFTALYTRAKHHKYNVVVQIFQYLGMRELAVCARVCRLWRELAATPQLWRHVRMKNSHVSDWGGLCAALKRHGTVRLDLRKMLLPQNDTQFWEQFAQHIPTVDTIERIEMCRCPASAVEAVCRGLPNLRSLSALAIRDALLDPAPLGALPLLHELRLKSMAGLSLTRDLRPLAALTNLQHLSLTSIKELGWCASDIIGQLEQLESLELGECTFRAEFASVLRRLRRLRRLRLERGTAQCAAPQLLRALAQLPLLTRLELVNIDVKVGFDDALAECKNIQRLLIIPTYVSQSATTNKQVLSGVLRLKDTLTHLMWGVTIELLRVTELFIDQCEQAGTGAPRDLGECIPVLKPVPGCRLPDHHHVQGPPQVEILPLPTLQRLLSAQMPNTKLKLLRIPFHATWRQSLADFQ